MTEAADRPQLQAQESHAEVERRSLLTDRTTVAALLVIVSAAILVVIGLTNRHDHSTHDHPTSNVSAVDASASEVAHDHSTHVHSEDIGATFVSTERISPAAACRTIIGCSDAGPKPQSPGDRGGWAQFMTLGAVAIGLAFIASRIVRATRAARNPRGGAS